jgi:hypothetical protein
MSYSLSFKFALSSKVQILPVGVGGDIVGLYFFLTEGRKYLVRWWEDSNVREEFFYEWELQ